MGRGVSIPVFFLLGCAALAHCQRPPADDEDFTFPHEGSGRAVLAPPVSQPARPAPSEDIYGSEVNQRQPTDYGRPQTDYGQPQTNYGQPQTNYGRSPTDYGQPQTNYGRSPTDYDQPQTNYGRSPTDYGSVSRDDSPDHGSGDGDDEDYGDYGDYEDEYYDGDYDYDDYEDYEDGPAEGDEEAGGDGDHEQHRTDSDHFDPAVIVPGHHPPDEEHEHGVVRPAPPPEHTDLPERGEHDPADYGTEHGHPPPDYGTERRPTVVPDLEVEPERDNGIELAPEVDLPGHEEDSSANAIPDDTVGGKPAAAGADGMPEGMGSKVMDRPTFFQQPGILAAVVGGAVVGLLCAILLVMLIVYRMRKKDEGSYALDEPKRSLTGNSYSKNYNKEFYA